MKRLYIWMLAAAALTAVCLLCACADPSEPPVGEQNPAAGMPGESGEAETPDKTRPAEPATEIVSETEKNWPFTEPETVVETSEHILHLSPLPDPLPADGDYPVFPMRFSSGIFSHSAVLDGYFTGRYDNLIALPWEDVSNFGEVVDSYARWQALYAPPAASEAADAGDALLMTYDEAFFETHSLVVVISEYGTGSLTYTGLSAAAEDGVFRIRLSTHCPEVVTEDMAYRVIVVPMEKSLGLPVEVRMISKNIYLAP